MQTLEGTVVYERDEIFETNLAFIKALEENKFDEIRSFMTEDISMGNVVVKNLRGIDAASIFLTMLPKIDVPNAEILWQMVEGNRVIVKWRQYFHYDAKEIGKDHIYCDGYGELIYSGNGKYSYYYGIFDILKMVWLIFRNLGFRQHLRLIQDMRIARKLSKQFNNNIK